MSTINLRGGVYGDSMGTLWELYGGAYDVGRYYKFKISLYGEILLLSLPEKRLLSNLGQRIIALKEGVLTRKIRICSFRVRNLVTVRGKSYKNYARNTSFFIKSGKGSNKMPVKTMPEKRKINRFGQKQKQAAIKL